jgi:hypothetical protein
MPMSNSRVFKDFSSMYEPCRSSCRGTLTVA